MSFGAIFAARSSSRALFSFVGVLLAIEFLDELVFGAREAAWPVIRDDLDLSYTQVGLLIAVPGVVSGLVEPALGILGDTKWRRTVILAGGFCFAAGVLMTALSPSFAIMMAAFILLYPASGAFVSLSQASLMDSDPARHDHLMARWTFAGSLGVVGGPLLLGAFIFLGAGWREVFIAMAALSLVIVFLARRHTFNGAHESEETTVRTTVSGAWRALRMPRVWRWLILLECSDLLLDTLLAFMALYLVDEAGASTTQAAIAVAVWAIVGLAGDGLLIPLLDRVPSLRYLRVSAGLMLLVFPLFLLLPWFWAKVGILGVIGLLNAGWYAIPQGRLYSTLPGQSGTVVAISAAVGVVTQFDTLLLGAFADSFGIDAMMWLLLIGPAALLVGLPRHDGRLMGEESGDD